ncbi:MAG: helix-turn-helix domain-containing protein [Lepagella sp.]
MALSLVVGFSFQLFSANIPRDNRPADVLLREGISLIEKDTLLEKAVASLSEVSNRYYDDPENLENRRNAVKSMTELGKLYSIKLFDYPKSYRYLSTAKMIAEEIGDNYNLARIYAMLANLYVLCGDPNDRTRRNIDSLHHLSAKAGLEGHNEDMITGFVINIAMQSFKIGNYDKFDDEIIKIKYYPFKSTINSKISLGIIDALDAFSSKNYEKTIEILNDLILLNNDNRSMDRHIYSISRMLQSVYHATGNRNAEERLIRSQLSNSIERGQKDFELFAYAHLSSFYESIEYPDSARFYHIKYLLLKNEMENESGLDGVVNIEMLDKIDAANDEIRELSVEKMKSKRRLMLILSISCVVFVCAVVLLILFFNLRRNHRTLYRQNLELLDVEAQYRLLLKNKDLPDAAILPSADNSDSLHRDTSDAPDDAESDAELMDVFASIINFMESSDEIYHSGFNLESLAEKINAYQRVVSKAINSCAGKNFHQFLNGYRIREACRIMPETDPRIHTVEYIADRVGFKSRTSFATLFRKSTGLTPSDYWKMSREGK